jgi:transcriptional regulator with XRE-family HTH domain
MNNKDIQNIKSIPPLELAKIANVSRDMAQKYKKGHSLPRLDKAFLIEDELGIPARHWAELKKLKENNQ